MILLFSVQLGWLPASGYVSPFEDLRANLAAMIMPAFVLGNAIAGVLMRHMRSAMLQVLTSDYVRTARSKGLHERTVVLKHALRNALTPVITLGALELGTLLSGAVLTDLAASPPTPGCGSDDSACRPVARAWRLRRARGDVRAGGGAGLRRDGAGRTVDRAARPHRHQLERDPQATVGRTLVRHRRHRPRRALAGDLGHTGVAAGGRGSVCWPVCWGWPMR
jgi:hypothetical protein